MGNPNPKNLTAAELRAIEEHKYYLSQKRQTEVSIDDAIDDFVQTYQETWRREKFQNDNQAQVQEIKNHKYLRSQVEGHDIGSRQAAREWCAQYAPIWRDERESLERNGFHHITVKVKTEHGIHMRPSSALAEIVRRHDVDVYVHKDGMEIFNFLLHGIPYLNVRSVIGLLTLQINQGDTLKFIAIGARAQDALTAIAANIAARQD